MTSDQIRKIEARFTAIVSHLPDIHVVDFTVKDNGTFCATLNRGLTSTELDSLACFCTLGADTKGGIVVGWED